MSHNETSLSSWPSGRVPSRGSACRSLFVTAIDTHPLAPSPEKVVEGRDADWAAGMQAVSKLTEGTVWLCTAPGSPIGAAGASRVQVEQFRGPHPAGLAGTHIHMLDPVNREKTVWHLGYQDVLAIGRLLRTGELDMTRVVSLAGPQVRSPRLLKTRIGASVDELVAGQLKEGENRVVSGPLLGGRKAAGEQYGFLGRYHLQVSAVAEDRKQRFLGWLAPGLDTFSTSRVYLSSLLPGKKFDFTTTNNGALRAMVPIGAFERVMPLDILPTYLLRALLMDDLENAEALGCLELDEEDLALCSFVCSGKEDYGAALRRNLTTIWKEG